jgi:hypothetical protein
VLWCAISGALDEHRSPLLFGSSDTVYKTVRRYDAEDRNMNPYRLEEFAYRVMLFLNVGGHSFRMLSAGLCENKAAQKINDLMRDEAKGTG